MWICSSHKEEKFHDSNPDLRSDLTISAQGLPAVFVAEWRGVLGKSGCCEEEWTPIIICDADKALHLLTQGTLSTFRINVSFHRVI